MTKNLKYLFASLLFGSFLIFGCDETDSVDPTQDFQPDYQNQTLQGKINGVDWTAVNGTANSTQLGVSDTFSHLISVIDTVVDTNCITSPTRSKLLFGFQDQSSLVPLGEKKLKLDFGNLANNFTVTFVHFDAQGTPQNNIAVKGAYEIQTVDTVSKMITGRMDVRLDNDNFVNGNFSVRYCSWD